MNIEQEADAPQASFMKRGAEAPAIKFPVLTALTKVATVFPNWNNSEAADVALMAADKRTRKLVLPGEWGVGSVKWEPFPTPGERLADAPLWVEGMSHIVGFRSAPPQGVRTGILFAPTAGVNWPDLIGARFVVAEPGMLPFVLPGICLIDIGAHDMSRLPYADFLREQEGMNLARKASRAQLLEMYEHVRLLDGVAAIACLRKDGGVSVRDSVEPYYPIRDHGTEGLRAAFAATVVQPDARAMSKADTVEARVMRMLTYSLLLRGPHAALSALRLSALQLAALELAGPR